MERVTFRGLRKVINPLLQNRWISPNCRRGKILFSEIEIGDDVCGGANAVFLSAVTHIGAGSVIAAASVVRSNMPANTIAAGALACGIRCLDLV